MNLISQISQTNQNHAFVSYNNVDNGEVETIAHYKHLIGSCFLMDYIPYYLFNATLGSLSSMRINKSISLCSDDPALSNLIPNPVMTVMTHEALQCFVIASYFVSIERMDTHSGRITLQSGCFNRFPCPFLRKTTLNKMVAIVSQDEFISLFGDVYCEHSEDFPSCSGHIHLNAAAAPPIPKPVLDAFVSDVSSHLYGSPHSNSPSAKRTLKAIKRVRARILEHFNTDEYSVVFTANATGALALLSRSLKIQSLHYHQHSHTSVLGLRQSIEFHCLTSTEMEDLLNSGESCQHHSLLSYPAQSNFSGERYPLNWVSRAQSKGFTVLLDLASYCANSAFDLSAVQPDFAVLSFYKLFGFPTSVGALLIKNTSASLLTKSYFGGGTVTSIAADSNHVTFANLPGMFEDGTLPFTEIIALTHGFNYIEERFGSWRSLSAHTHALAEYTRHHMKQLSHQTPGCPPICVVYDPLPDSKLQVYQDDDEQHHGPIIAFNLKRPDGSFIGYSHVAKLAGLFDIHLRVGCFCNPGSCQDYLSISAAQVKENANVHGHICGDQVDLVHGKPTGAVRISFGLHSTFHDVLSWFRFLSDFYIQSVNLPNLIESPQDGQISIESIVIYPVKSCAGLEVNNWPLDSTGLALDRHFVILDVVTEKMATLMETPKLCLIQPVSVDLESNILILSAPGMPNLSIPFTLSLSSDIESSLKCLDLDSIRDIGNPSQECNEWFSSFLEMDVKLVQRSSHNSPSASYANESPFLIVSTKTFESVQMVVNQVKDPSLVSFSLANFRGNIVLNGQMEPFQELDWVKKKLVIGSTLFVVEKGCVRCPIIGVDTTTSKVSRRPLQTLSKNFRKNVLLNQGRVKLSLAFKLYFIHRALGSFK